MRLDAAAIKILMHSQKVIKLTAGLVAAAVVSGCSRPAEITGEWRAQDKSDQTIEFLKDGSWNMHGATLSVGEKQLPVSMSGIYKIRDSNHIEMAFGIYGDRNPFTLSYSLSSNELKLQTINLNGDFVKYRRVKNL